VDGLRPVVRKQLHHQPGEVPRIYDLNGLIQRPRQRDPPAECRPPDPTPAEQRHLGARLRIVSSTIETR
jgi:hypothetical protein